MIEASIPSVLRERASLQPDDIAVTYLDYDHAWDGDAESLTWAQLYQRACGVAVDLSGAGAPGDRAVILAPQGLDYLVAFLGALLADRIAVPLSVPLGGVADERVDLVLRDASPTAVLTTSAAADAVAGRLGTDRGTTLIEVDRSSRTARYRADGETAADATAYLQYTSGSTREPAGVMMSHANVQANFEQLMSGYFSDRGRMPPPDTTILSWLPFYHDMGLLLGVCAPVILGLRTVLTSPVAFLQRPARWMQLMASHGHVYTAGPNFAFEVAARKTTDEDMAGLDLGDVLTIVTGSERVHPATLRRFTQRFARFNLRESAIRPSYGLAEATVYVATRAPGEPPKVVHFDAEKLSEGHAEPLAGGRGTPLVSYGVPEAPLVRIVDPQTRIERPAGTTGEIWVHGGNVALGYWGQAEKSESTFGGVLAEATDGTPAGPWLRTGDLGFVAEGELFIVGRIKDLLIVHGRNHSPDDIEATIQEITHGRVAAISIADGHTEKLVAIVEQKKRGASEQESAEALANLRRDVATAVFAAHGLSIADLVLVPPGAIPITTSGKVRRSSCVEYYRHGRFDRLDA
ncbi:long-chain-fatty-acid--AMP ligase FadD28 [Mycolicibacterium madagascariense]|uniref:Long-chain-fatty-acid--AMP ligase FadD28 n=1 Tax=Mycolicibacterium madagascariense TaxID=212765 RepID=A0A7I7XG13_9MYCO|nr:AMP-binding protein [Mycolicibacterium madagascariense]MCV7014740.1 AMP-binding protein [Mycolicibacterium madagascariense]BBZ28132.1 long-chain-fatty-acid--AMP ligase FadD28 [Mycolicibacterium madagascariense]